MKLLDMTKLRIVFRGAAQVHKTAFGKHVDAMTIGERVFVHLWLDIELGDAFRGIKAVHLNLVVEMANVANNGLIFHLCHVIERDDVAVAGRRDVNISNAERIFDGGERILRNLPCALACRRIDGVDLGDDHARAETAQRM